MTETKDKIVSLELLKVYHDYNEENYSKPIHLTFDGSVIRDSENSALSFSQIFSMTSDKTISVDVLNDSRVMLCINNSSSAIDFIDLHVTGGKYFIGWLSIGNDNRVAYKDVGIALSGDIVKNLSQMVDDNYTKDNWPSKFTITLEAGELASYTNKILDNKNTFPEGNGDEIASRLRNYTMQIYLDCYQANDWRVMSADDYRQRRELQEHALDMCELCLPLIQLAKHHFHLETKRMMYWGKKVIDLRDKILNWMKSDKARYAEKFCVT